MSKPTTFPADAVVDPIFGYTVEQLNKASTASIGYPVVMPDRITGELSIFTHHSLYTPYGSRLYICQLTEIARDRGVATRTCPESGEILTVDDVTLEAVVLGVTYRGTVKRLQGNVIHLDAV